MKRYYVVFFAFGNPITGLWVKAKNEDEALNVAEYKMIFNSDVFYDSLLITKVESC